MVRKEKITKLLKINDMDERMKVTALHMVGEYKYIILHNLKDEESPCRVYLTEANINVKPAYDNEEGRCLSVSVKYKATDAYGGLHSNIAERDIYDTKEEAERVIGWRK